MSRILYPDRRFVHEKLFCGTSESRNTLTIAPHLKGRESSAGLSRKRPESVWWKKFPVGLFLCLGAFFATNPAHAAASKTITHNNNANLAILEDDGIPANKLVRLRSENGSFSTITFEMPTSELVIHMAGGNVTLNAGSGQFDTFFGSCSTAKSFSQTTVEGASNSEFVYTNAGDAVQIRNCHGFDTYIFETLAVPQLSIDNGSGGSSTKIRSKFPDPGRAGY